MSDLLNGLHELVRQDNDRLRKEIAERDKTIRELAVALRLSSGVVTDYLNSISGKNFRHRAIEVEEKCRTILTYHAETIRKAGATKCD
jgi:hypothetical protein